MLDELRDALPEESPVAVVEPKPITIDRSRRAAELLWEEVCRGIRAGRAYRVFAAVLVLAAGLSQPGSAGSVTDAPFAPGSDITTKQGISVGGMFVPWGTATILPESLAYVTALGKCIYRVSYDMTNLGGLATSPVFKNTLSVGAVLVSQNDSLALSPLQSKQVTTKATFSPGTFDLILRLDAANAVPELDESNNVRRVRLTLDGKCQGKAGAVTPGTRAPAVEGIKGSAPQVPSGPVRALSTVEQPAPTAGASTSGIIIHDAAQPGRYPGPIGYRKPAAGSAGTAVAAKPLSDIVLKNLKIAGAWKTPQVTTINVDAATSAQGFKNGRCLLDLAYDLENAGKAPAGSFNTTIDVANQYPPYPKTVETMALAAGDVAPVSTIAGFAPGTNHLTVTADADHAVTESGEDNNAMKVTVVVLGMCQGPGLPGLGQ